MADRPENAERVEKAGTAVHEREHLGARAVEAPDANKFDDASKYKEAYGKFLDSNNFSLPKFEKGWGPFQAIEALGKKGELDLGSIDVLAEARRIRDRELATRPDGKKHFTTQDGTAGHEIMRWSPQEKDAKLDEAMRGFEKALTGRKIDAAVPDAKIMDGALKANGVTGVSGEQFRDAIKGAIAAEIEKGTLKPEDLKANNARVGAYYVAAGVLTAGEVQDTLKQQSEERAKMLNGAKLSDLPKDKQQEIFAKTSLEAIMATRFADRDQEWKDKAKQFSGVYNAVQAEVKKANGGGK